MPSLHENLILARRLYAQASAHIQQKRSFDVAAHFCYQAALRSMGALLQHTGVLSQETRIDSLLIQSGSTLPPGIPEAARFLDRFRAIGTPMVAPGASADSTRVGVVKGFAASTDAIEALVKCDDILNFVEHELGFSPGTPTEPFPDDGGVAS